jgi:urease accessory protein
MNALPAFVAPGQEAANRAWQARLELEFAPVGPRTALVRRQHVGPLLVQRPFYPEGGTCHVYLVHPPGGIVGGDRLSLQACCRPGSHALVTTPAATKFYRAGPHPQARLVQSLEVQDAALEWLPQESILFDGARARASTSVHLTGGARFLGWEITCLGRPSSQESFREGSLATDFRLYRDGVPLLLDRLRLAGDSPALHACWGLCGMQALGTLLVTPGTGIDLAPLRGLQAPGVRFAFTRTGDVLVCRALALQAEPLRELFTRVWLAVRPQVLAREAVPPRIWAT